MKKKQLKALLIGACHVDIFADTEFEFGGSTGMDLPGDFVVSLGGTVFNVCTGLRTLGVDCFLVSTVKKDSIFTRLIESELTGIGLRRYLITVETSKESAFLAVRQKGELVLAVTSSVWDVVKWNDVKDAMSSFLAEKNHDFAVVDCNLPEDILANVISFLNCGCYVCCVSPAKVVRFVNIIKNNQFREQLSGRSTIKGVFMNEDEFRVVLSCGIDPFSADYNFFRWFITKGKEGVSVICDGRKLDFRVKEIVNAKSFSGAGDAFASGVIYALESGSDLKEAVNLGYEMVLEKVKNKNASVVCIDLAEVAKTLDVDLLTGCFNRNAFEKDKVFLKGFTHILLIDVDYFKKFNDTYGHDYGDRILREVANLIRSSLRKSDRVYRYGGEEFVVFLFDTTDHSALEIAKRINFVVREKTPVTVTIGISRVTDSIDGSVKRADVALYRGKRSGRNCVVFYQDFQV